MRWCWVNFQCRGRPTISITVGQGPTALAVGAGGGCLDIFTLIYLFSPFSPSLWETARYRLKYCLKGPLNPKQPTNQLPFCRFSLTNVLTYSLTSFHFRPKIFHIVSVCIGSLCSANGSVSISTGCSIALPYTSLRGLIPILS